MPCVGCEKECKCTAEKCCESCKYNAPGKCGCNPANVAKSNSGGCCNKMQTAEGKTEKGCCNPKKE